MLVSVTLELAEEPARTIDMIEGFAAIAKSGPTLTETTALRERLPLVAATVTK